MVPQVISALAGALSLAAGFAGADPPLTGDIVDADALHLLQTRAGLVSKHSFFFWSEPETPGPTQIPVILADAGRGVTAAAASPASTPAKRTQKDEAGTQSLENELKDFISNVKSPVFISHEAVQHAGQDCWEPCGKKGGSCAWCGSGNACCRSGWDKNPAECVGVSGYKTKKHECVGPAAGEVELIASNSSLQPAEAAASSAVEAVNATANATAAARGNATAAANASATDLSSGAHNSTGRHGHKHNASSMANRTGVHYHAGDAQHDWRSLPIGGLNAPLTSWGFSVVTSLRSGPEMSRFARRLIDSMHCRVVDEADFHSVIPGVSENWTYKKLVGELDTLCDAAPSSPSSAGRKNSTDRSRLLDHESGHGEEAPAVLSSVNASFAFGPLPGNASLGAAQENSSSPVSGVGGVANATGEE